jgi:hypothetical protein
MEAEKEFSLSEPQTLLELVSARCVSHLLVVLTDITTGALAYTLSYDADQKVYG